MGAEVLDEELEIAGQSPRGPKKEHKVVIHLNTGEMIRGYIEADSHKPAPCLGPTGFDASRPISVRIPSVDDPLTIQLQDLKAIFVVKSFRGDPKRKGLRFYSNGPAVGHIWVEIQFKDDEILEGLVDNSVQHLLADGFWLRPSDTGGNNICVYVNKAAIADYRVLGVRALQ